MRFSAILFMIAALASPSLAFSQDEPLNPNPMTWHGVQLGAERVFEGEFIINYETSTFRPDGAAAEDTVWLSGWEDRPGDSGGITRRYHLRFVGRQTIEPGKFGSLGAFRNNVLITKLLSARLVSQH